MIIAVDPGKRFYGVACFENKILERAAYVEQKDLKKWLGGDELFAKAVYLERQYLPKRHPRPMDIVDLSFAAGFVKGLVFPTNVIEYQPVTWKGNVPKEIMTKRILARLSPEEVDKIEKVGYKDHNTIDAVGIGLYALGRLH